MRPGLGSLSRSQTFLFSFYSAAQSWCAYPHDKQSSARVMTVGSVMAGLLGVDHCGHLRQASRAGRRDACLCSRTWLARSGGPRPYGSRTTFWPESRQADVPTPPVRPAPAALRCSCSWLGSLAQSFAQGDDGSVPFTDTRRFDTLLHLEELVVQDLQRIQRLPQQGLVAPDLSNGALVVLRPPTPADGGVGGGAGFVAVGAQTCKLRLQRREAVG